MEKPKLSHFEIHDLNLSNFITWKHYYKEELENL